MPRVGAHEWAPKGGAGSAAEGGCTRVGAARRRQGRVLGSKGTLPRVIAQGAPSWHGLSACLRPPTCA